VKCDTIGFLGIHHFENGDAIRGGILVTDKATKPLEFRVTSPVRPERFQKMLYGEILDEHIAVNLLGLPLLESVEQQPDLLVFRNPLLLNISLRHPIPSMLILAKEESLPSKVNVTKVLEPPNSTYSSIKVCTHSSHSKEGLEIVIQHLQEIFMDRDLLEPFARLDLACEDVHSRKIGDS
jgi:hypothetical protein